MYVKVYFRRCVTNLAELMKIFNKWSHVVLPSNITQRYAFEILQIVIENLYNY
jgi:hypothetical protein